MKLHYWGTAAAEGVPSIFCNCKVCREAREKGGRYVRTRSQIMIDDKLLIDFNADTYAHTLAYGYNMSQLGDVLITHVHEDHYYPYEFHNRQNGFAYDMQYPTLTIHGSEDVKTQFDYCMEGNDYLIKQGRMAFDVLKPFETKEIAGYEVTPLPATHGTKNPFVYIIEKDGKTVFVLNDCGTMKPEVFEWLKNSKKQFDLISYDCTMGNMNTYVEWGKDASHMGLPNVIETRKILTENGNRKDTTVDIITHFSHNGPSVGYGDMKELADQNGFLLAFDGFKLEI